MMCKKRLRNPAITAIFAVSNFEIRPGDVTSVARIGRALFAIISRFVADAKSTHCASSLVIPQQTRIISDVWNARSCC